MLKMLIPFVEHVPLFWVPFSKSDEHLPSHSKMSTTMDIYSHVVPSMQKEAVKRFAMALEVGG